MNADGFTGQPCQPLDVVQRGVARVFENDNVPAFRVGELVRKLGYQDAVAVVSRVRPVLGIVGRQVGREAAHRAGGMVDPGRHFRVGAIAGADLVAVAARRANHLFVLSQDRRGHCARRNHECLHEHPRDKSQAKCANHAETPPDRARARCLRPRGPQQPSQPTPHYPQLRQNRRQGEQKRQYQRNTVRNRLRTHFDG